MLLNECKSKKSKDIIIKFISDSSLTINRDNVSDKKMESLFESWIEYNFI